MSERVYPIRPESDEDPRFTFGLTREVAEVLERHGYPPVSAGGDLVDLQQALYRFLYTGDDGCGWSR